mgnify:CR=1 FL=1
MQSVSYRDSIAILLIKGNTIGVQILAYVGDGDGMLECLAESAERHLWYVRVDPVFDPYRADPRFARILAEAGYGPG